MRHFNTNRYRRRHTRGHGTRTQVSGGRTRHPRQIRHLGRFQILRGTMGTGNTGRSGPNSRSQPRRGTSTHNTITLGRGRHRRRRRQRQRSPVISTVGHRPRTFSHQRCQSHQNSRTITMRRHHTSRPTRRRRNTRFQVPNNNTANRHNRNRSPTLTLIINTRRRRRMFRQSRPSRQPRSRHRSTRCAIIISQCAVNTERGFLRHVRQTNTSVTMGRPGHHSRRTSQFYYQVFTTHHLAAYLARPGLLLLEPKLLVEDAVLYHTTYTILLRIASSLLAMGVQWDSATQDVTRRSSRFPRGTNRIPHPSLRLHAF